MAEKFDNAATPERGLFWRALRAPEWERASKEFNGAFTKIAQQTAFFYSALLFGPWVIAAGILAQVVGNLVSSGMGYSGSYAVEFLASAIVVYLVYVVFSAFWSWMLFVHFNPCFRVFRAPIPGDFDALTGRTAKRMANVYFARFLRRLIFPWEWYLGRP